MNLEIRVNPLGHICILLGGHCVAMLRDYAEAQDFANGLHDLWRDVETALDRLGYLPPKPLEEDEVVAAACRIMKARMM